jgi:hypothetical protein
MISAKTATVFIVSAIAGGERTNDDKAEEHCRGAAKGGSPQSRGRRFAHLVGERNQQRRP